MHTGKTLIALAATAVMATSCLSGVKQENEALKEELATTQDRLNNVLEGNMALSNDMQQIFDDIAAVSGETVMLRSGIEDGYAEMNQAEQIEEHINAIRRKLDALEKKARRLDQSLATIKKLNAIVSQQAEEIVSLKESIAEKEQEIRSQRDTIASRDLTIAEREETILEQRNKLQQTVMRQAELLYLAGKDLEEIGDNMPEVSRKKNQIKVGAHTQTIYQCALTYYEQALEGGYQAAAASIEQIKTKIMSDEQ